ncbi:MAG: exo-alpha-sialidase [Armatimonadetes bacterium]|nr:exo-alpha-sialidase [Armatimonadota bacterium]
MIRRNVGRVAIVIGASIVAGSKAGEGSTSSFTYGGGKPTGSLARVHEVTIPEVKGTAHVYCTFEMGASNPVPCVDGQPKELQIVTVGQETDGRFVPAVRFGMHDGRNLPTEKGYITPWVTDGRLDYYGCYARPNTPCDFKLTVDLRKQLATVWCTGRGDDDWFLLAEAIPLMAEVETINEVHVEQYPGAPGIHDFVVQSKPWRPGEKPRPHPLAKKERAVKPGAGFRFQSMRSVWRKPGRHVSIGRKPPVWMGFPDVVQTGQQTLVCTHNDGVGHGGGGKLLVRHSDDLGKTWGEPMVLHESGINCPRLQKLKDGSLLLLADVGGTTPVLLDSFDGGKTWTNKRFLEPREAGGNQVCVPSRVTELPDGSWLMVGSWYPGGKAFEGTEGERLEFYHSTDRGNTWKFCSYLQAYPPHSLSEASVLVLPDGRLLLYAREARADGHPGIKAYSYDNGKTWGQVEELPFAITGRTCAGFLPDGRVMVTFRSGIGRSALWAWIGEPEDHSGFRIAGAHFNDAHSVGLKGGVLHLDNDGASGQFTQYFLRPPDGPETEIDLTAEVKVVSNAGRAATLSVPFVGKFRLFPDRIELAHEPTLSFEVKPNEFHIYRVLSQDGRAKLYVDGNELLETDKVDRRARRCGWTPAEVSVYPFAFGNEVEKDDSSTNVYLRDITPNVSGYSLWRRVEATLDDPVTGKRVISWSAKPGEFPDQDQLDHIVEIDASIDGHDQGYSGWIALEDGRLFVVNYTDDTAPTCPPTGLLQMGVSWIRGTYLRPLDLPVSGTKAD